MAIINYKGDIERNLQEQVAENKRLILQHYNTTRTLELFDVKVIGVLPEWEEPEGQTFEYGDAYFVGTEVPYSLYIFTRADSVHPNDYWLEIEDLIVQGPPGRPLTFDDLTEAQKEQLRGEPGVSPKWFVVNKTIGVSGPKEGDMLLQGSTGNIYQYQDGNFALKTNIKGKDGRGIYWMRINGNGELLVDFDNGTQTNLGKVVGSPGKDGAPGRDGITTVVNIIGELPADSIISNTYDPATVEPNSAVIMPVDGTNHVFIVVDGIWADGGPFSGGSSVYAGGQFQTSFNADTKLDKKAKADLPVSGRGAVYGIDTNGDQTLITVGRPGSFSSSDDKNAIPVYDGAGHLYARQTALNDSVSTRVATIGFVRTAIQMAHNNTDIFHLGVFGAKTADVSGLPLYTIPIAPFGNSSNIQLKCDLMTNNGSGYENVPIPTYIQFRMTSPPDPDGNTEYHWTVYEAFENSELCSGICGAITTDEALENAYFQISDDSYYNEVYITIHCPHDSSWYFPG